MSEHILWQVLGNACVRIPIFAVCMTGIVLALMRWKQRPRAALLVVVALVLFGLHSAFNSLLWAFLPQFLVDTFELHGEEMAWTFRGVTFVVLLIDAVIIFLLILAALSASPARKPIVPEYDDISGDGGTQGRQKSGGLPPDAFRE